MSYLLPKDKPKPKPKAKAPPKAVVTHVYPRHGEHTVKVKELLDLEVTPEEFWASLPERSELKNWLTRNYGKSGKNRDKSVSEICWIFKDLLLKKIKHLL